MTNKTLFYFKWKLSQPPKMESQLISRDLDLLFKSRMWVVVSTCLSECLQTKTGRTREPGNKTFHGCFFFLWSSLSCLPNWLDVTSPILVYLFKKKNQVHLSYKVRSRLMFNFEAAERHHFIFHWIISTIGVKVTATMKSFQYLLALLLITLLVVDAAIVDNRNSMARQSGIMSFFTGLRSTPRPSSSSSESPNTLSGLATLASGIQSVPSFQSILDASGITRLTDPVYNQVRKRWQAIVNR